MKTIALLGVILAVSASLQAAPLDNLSGNCVFIISNYITTAKINNINLIDALSTSLFLNAIKL